MIQRVIRLKLNKKYCLISLLLCIFCGCTSTKPVEDSAMDSKEMLEMAKIQLDSIQRMNLQHADLFKKVELFEGDGNLKELYYEFYIKTIKLSNTSLEAREVLRQIEKIIDSKMTESKRE